MHLYDLNNAEFEVVGGRKRLTISGEAAEFAMVEREPGAEDGHSHPNEQFVYFLEGKAEFHVGDEKQTVGAGQVLHIPISHGEGSYYTDPATLKGLNDGGQVLFRYCDPSGVVDEGANPNGSVENIAGIVNREGNVLGMMPHPERCCESLLGGTDGRFIFESVTGSRR